MIAIAEVKRHLSYVWVKESDQKESYEFQFAGDSELSCVRNNAAGARKFKLAFDRASGTLWWGESYFLDPSEFAAAPERAQWYRASDYKAKKRRAAFVWIRRAARHSEVRPSPQAAAAKHPGQSTSTKLVVKAAPPADPQPAPRPGPPAAAAAEPRRRSASASAGAAGDGGRRAAQAAATQPEVILDLEQLLVIYKPPYWRCELPPKGEWAGDKGSRGPQILLRWIREKILDIDAKLFEEEFNPALSGTGFGPLSHRIDQETSGPLLVAKTVGAQRFLKAQFHKTAVSKRYICLVHGKMEKSSGTISASIRTLRTDQATRSEVSSSGDWAQTDYQVVGRYGPLRTSRDGSAGAAGYSLVACDIKTGRTHQIRVHMLHLGHPLVADYKYLSPEEVAEDRAWCPRLFLHAYRLGFRSLRNEQELVVCPLPLDLKTALVRLGAAEIDANASDLLFGETSWQREVFRPKASQWRPGTRLQRRVAAFLAESEGELVPLQRLNTDSELHRMLVEDGLVSIDRHWLSKHYDLFEVVQEDEDAEVKVRLRDDQGETYPELELERQCEAVRSELEHLDRLKQRAVAEEDYAQAAEVKRRAEAARAELRTLQELLGEAQDADEAEGDDVPTYAEARAREQARLAADQRVAQAFSDDVQDLELFPSLVSKKGVVPLVMRPSAHSDGVVGTSVVGRTGDSGVVGGDVAGANVGNGQEGVVLPLKDALYEFLSKRESCVAHINEINNDKFLRAVMTAQQPKPIAAVNKHWVREHEDVFVMLRTADNDTYIALCKAAQSKSKSAKQVKGNGGSEQAPTKNPAYDRVIQKISEGDPNPLVYRYSAKARAEDASGIPGGSGQASAAKTSDEPEVGQTGGGRGAGDANAKAWQDLLAEALRRLPQKCCSAQELLGAVPQFADATGARGSREQQELLVLFLEGFPKLFRVERQGAGAEKQYIVRAV